MLGVLIIWTATPYTTPPRQAPRDLIIRTALSSQIIVSIAPQIWRRKSHRETMMLGTNF